MKTRRLTFGLFLVYWLIGLNSPCIAIDTVEAQARTRKYAVLVGVNSYPILDKDHQLSGPAHDVSLMQAILLSRGFSKNDIVILADGMPEAKALPTHSNIVSVLRDLARPGRLRAGDFVYLHFSGHGNRQPTRVSAAEPNGFDEMFLPLDIGKWDGDVGTVKNSLLDTELGSLIDNIRNAGASVWLVVDSCHSGTMSRGIARQTQTARTVPPSMLGIPERMPAAPSDRRTVEPGSSAQGKPRISFSKAAISPHAGSLVAFFASQSEQITSEAVLPTDAQDGKTYGLFTFTLATALESTGNVTYRQLAQKIKQDYARQARLTPTPSFEGDLSFSVFGEPGRPTDWRQWPLSVQDQHIELRAGKVQGVDEGSILAVVPSPLSSMEEAVRLLRVKSATILTSELEASPPSPIKDFQSRFPKAHINSKSGLADGMYARLLSSSLDLSIRVGEPISCGDWTLSPQCVSDADTLDHARAVFKLASLSSNVQVAPPKMANIQLVVHKRKIWLLLDQTAAYPFDGQSPSISLEQSPERAARELGESLRKMAKVLNLERLIFEVQSPDVKLEVKVQATSKVAGQKTNYSLTQEMVPPMLHPGDGLRFAFLNASSDRFVHVTMLAIDSHYGITPVEDFRIPAHASEPVVMDATIDGNDLGLSHMLIIATKEDLYEETPDFSYLSQPSIPVSEGTKGRKEPLQVLFEQAGFGVGGARGIVSDPPAKMSQFSWRVSSPESPGQRNSR